VSHPRVFEIWADEIATPLSKGGFQKWRPGFLQISSGKILKVGKISRAKLRSANKQTLRFKTITPGFVDSHTHLVFGGDRSEEWNERLKGATYQEIAARGGGIQKTVRLTRDSSPQDLLELSLERCRRFLSYGVTSLEAKSGYGLDLETELKILKVIQATAERSPIQLFPTFMGAHARPKEFSSNRLYIDYLIESVLPKVKGLARFQDVFCESGYFSEEESIRILEAGKKFGLIPKVHAHEFGRTGGVRVAARVGAVSAEHLMHLSDEDIALLKKAKVIPVVLSGTSFFLGAKKFSPARKLWDSGLKLALASDFNPGTNPTQNFPLIGSFAAIFQGLSLEEVLTAQTYHGALALGLGDRGCLEPRMRADFVAWDHGTFEEIYYGYGDSRVTSIYLGGKKVL
jgi:imidazolonepropionase